MWLFETEGYLPLREVGFSEAYSAFAKYSAYVLGITYFIISYLSYNKYMSSAKLANLWWLFTLFFFYQGLKRVINGLVFDYPYYNLLIVTDQINLFLSFCMLVYIFRAFTLFEDQDKLVSRLKIKEEQLKMFLKHELEDLGELEADSDTHEWVMKQKMRLLEMDAIIAE